MAFQASGASALNGVFCRYGTSRLLFRGPRQPLDRPYWVALGGTETYGKYIANPWPAILSHKTGRPVVNLGCLNAGLDIYLNDPSLMEMAARAELRIVQIVGAHNLTNRFFTVHPRRNDRFVRAGASLQSLYPDVDFTEFSFTRHLLTGLEWHGGDGRFEQVVAELRQTWLDRMRTLLEAIGTPTLLLWAADVPIPEKHEGTLTERTPPLIDAELIAGVADRATSIVDMSRRSKNERPGDPRLAALSGGAANPDDLSNVMATALGLPDQSKHRLIATRVARQATAFC